MKHLTITAILLCLAAGIKAQEPISMPVDEVRKAETIDDLNYDIPKDHTITSFRIVYVQPEKDPVFAVNKGRALTETSKRIVQSCVSGGTLFLELVKGSSPDQELIEMPAHVIKLE